jgi:hypothetical protein
MHLATLLPGSENPGNKKVATLVDGRCAAIFLI